jgi:hypothetical protein
LLTVVGDEIEAGALCGLLQTTEARSAHGRTARSAAIGTYGGGRPTAEVFVDDLEGARELLRE